MSNRDRECPKCGEPLELQEYDPDCGVEGGWFCTGDNCDYTAPYEPDDESDLDARPELPYR